MSTQKVADLPTPALVVDAAVLDLNIAAMAAALPGDRLRPHVKAHKCTSLAKRQAAAGHRGFTCATIRECEGMAAAGLGQDLMLANEVLDARRVGALVSDGARVTLAVDSPETIDAAARGGVREVIIDVNVGLPRCGCLPADAGRMADLARERGLEVRGVMGYEGHVMIVEDAADRAAQCQQSMEQLVTAAADVGGELIGGRHRHVRLQHLGDRDPGRLGTLQGCAVRPAGAPVPAGGVRAGERDLDRAGVVSCQRRP